ncbi:MerR family transcriptional regulator [Cellulomonas marina]|nr:MerR family transcriptional regulator [Cellulomonas marina]
MPQVAEVLGVSTDTVRRWVDRGLLPDQHDAAGRRVVDGAALAAVLRAQRHLDADGRSSARNRLPGIVTDVVRDGVMAQVELQAGPFRLVSLMSREAADELGLAPGVLAEAVVKATVVVVERAGAGA